MSLWLRSQYYCINTTGSCQYALGDVPFSTAEFERFEGVCRGHRADGCGAKLTPGDAQDLRPKWLLAAFLMIAILAGAAWTTQQVFFPPALQHVAFATLRTRTDDRVAVLALEVVRDANLNQRVNVEYQSADGSAKAGEDYQAAHGVITFEPGERRKSIQLAVLPDRTLEKQARFFSLTLSNVQGQPRHTVLIAPRAVDRSQELQTEQMVLSGSRIAADIAGFMVKRRVLLDLVTSRKAGRGEVEEYKQQLMTLQDNLSRAREGYAESLKELQTQEPTLVIRAMDRLHDDLARRAFAQQSRALAIMKKQFTELVNEQGMDMDRWTNELEDAVPHINLGAPKTAT